MNFIKRLNLNTNILNGILLILITLIYVSDRLITRQNIRFNDLAVWTIVWIAGYTNIIKGFKNRSF